MRHFVASFTAAMLSVVVISVVVAPAGLAQNAGASGGRDAFKNGLPVPAGCVAVIDGKTVRTDEFVTAIHRRFAGSNDGKAALADIIERKVIEWNMRKAGLTITDDQVRRHQADIDRRRRAKDKNAKDIRELLAESGRTLDEYYSRLRLQLALQKMAERAFRGQDVVANPNLQKTWLLSKTREAKVITDANRLPPNAAGKVYDQFITTEEFARNVLAYAGERTTLKLLERLMQRTLGRLLLSQNRLDVSDADLDRELAVMRRTFEANPQTRGLDFGTVLRERYGMGLADFRVSPLFFTEVMLQELGVMLVPDSRADAAYRQDADWYGPIYDLRHILVRGSDDTAHQGMVRSMREAKSTCDKVMERLRRGEKFDDLVKLYSEDARSKFSGGSLGQFTPKSAERTPAIAQALRGMEVGNVRGPLRAKKGYHIIQLAKKLPVPTMTPEVVREIRKRRATDLFRKRWEQARKGYDIRRFVSVR